MGPRQCELGGCSVLTDVKLESKAVATCCLETDAVELHPDVLFKLLATPAHHSCLFESINKVDSELQHDDGKGFTQWNVDYHAKWKFWKLGGVIKVAIVMDADAANRTVSFKLRENGFLNVFEGLWSVSAPSSTPVAGAGSSTGRGISFLRPSWAAKAVAANNPLPVAHITGISERLGSLGRHSPPISLDQASLSSSLPADILSQELAASVSPADHRALSTCSGLDGDAGGGGSSGLGEEPLDEDSDWQQASLDRTSSSGSDVSKASKASGAAAAPARPLAARAAEGSANGARPMAIVRFQQRMGPTMAPPYPLNQLLKGQLLGQARQMMEGLLMKAREMEAK